MKFTSKTALVLIDIQKGFDDLEYWGGNRNNPDAEEKAKKLLDLWRSKGWPIFHVKHNSTTPGSLLEPSHPGNELQEATKPIKGEPLFEKNVNSAFIGTNLKEQLDASGIKTVAIAGLTTDHCISTSVRMSGNLGFETYLVSDATATFDKVGADGKKYPAELIHETALASLHGEFATVLTTQQVMELI
ncbi:MAG: cysteine hydrolase family protein [Bacteroidota bacterium]